MGKQVLIMNFPERSSSFEAFSELKTLHLEKKIIIEQMAVVEHDSENTLHAKDFLDFTGQDKTAKGSLIGMLVGVLGGPLGILLGWATGSIIGSSGDAKEIKNAYSVFDKTLETIPKKSTGVIVIASEYAEEVVDKIVAPLDGTVTRLDYEKVEEEVRMAAETEKELKNEAKKRWFSKKDKS